MHLFNGPLNAVKSVLRQNKPNVYDKTNKNKGDVVMNKKALKVIGVIFGAILIFFGAFMQSSYHGNNPYSASIGFFLTSDWDAHSKSNGGYADAVSFSVSDDVGNERYYDVSDDGTKIVEIVAASQISDIENDMEWLLDTVYIFLVILGAGIIAVSLCIKTEKNAKKAKTLNGNIVPQV